MSDEYDFSDAKHGVTAGWPLQQVGIKNELGLPFISRCLMLAISPVPGSWTGPNNPCYAAKCLVGATYIWSITLATQTSPASIVCFIVASLLGAVGQYLYKSGADAADGAWHSYVVNPRLAGGVVCYIAVMVLFVVAFKLGGSLTVLYPIYASTFIWASLIAWRVYGTPITATNVLGMAFLVAGMLLLGKQG